MKGVSYKEVTIDIDGRSRTIRTMENYVSAFSFSDKIFFLLGTDHSISRIEERGICKYNVAGKIMQLGNRLVEYNDSGKHLLISDDYNDASYIITIERYTIVIITVMGHANARVSDKYIAKTVVI